MGKIVSKIPASESGPNVIHTVADGTVYYITRNPKKSQFTLWFKREDGYEKMATAPSPYDFYKSLYGS